MTPIVEIRNLNKSFPGLRVKPSDLVLHHAIMGVDLDGMRLDDVACEEERHRNGEARWFIRRTIDVIVGVVDGQEITRPETVEVDGLSAKTRRPMPGAYRKRFLDPDPVPTIIARAEHEIWLSALAMIAETVAGSLTETVMEASRIPIAPWADGAGNARVLPDLVAERRRVQADEDAKTQAFARRFPIWFRRLEKAAAKMREAA